MKKTILIASAITLGVVAGMVNYTENDAKIPNIGLDVLALTAMAQSEDNNKCWCWGQYVSCDDESCQTDCNQEPPTGNGDNMVEDYAWYTPPFSGDQPHGPNSGCYKPEPACCYYQCEVIVTCQS